MIAPGLTILFFVGGFVAQWAIMKSAVAGVQKGQEINTARINDAEDKIQKIEVGTAVSATDIRTIKDDLSEIKKDVKSILNRGK